MPDSAERDESGSRGTLGRAVRLLSFFADKGTDWRIRELAAEIGIPRSTVHRVAQALVEEGFLQYDSSRDAYGWGPELIHIAEAVHRELDIGRVAGPIMRELAARCDETVVLAQYDYRRKRLVFTAEVESTKPVRYHTELSVPLPVTAGASGKAIMAWLDDAELDQLLDAALPTLTDTTITDVGELREELARVRSAGLARSAGERVAEAVGMCCPIFDASGTVIGSLCITVPRYRFSEETAARMAPDLQRAAQRISHILGLPRAATYPPSRR
jgi:IclR family acetate operon transcriptional repressor